MGAAALPIMAVTGLAGTVGSFLQGNRAAQQAREGLDIAKQQLGMQQQAFGNLNQAAQGQQQLFGQTLPAYNQILGALQQNAGLGNQTFAGQQAQQILGQGATPADLARFTTLENSLSQAGQLARNNLQYNQSTRTPFGSSLAASQNAALQANLALGGAGLRSQIMDEAQQNYANRLQQLYGALAPGLAAGPEAANIYAQAGGLAGQGGQLGLGLGQQAFGQQQVFGGQLANTLQNYLQYQAMRPQGAPLSNYDFGGGGTFQPQGTGSVVSPNVYAAFSGQGP